MNKFHLITVLCIFFFLSCTREHDDTFEHFYLRSGNADLYIEVNGNIASDIFVIFLHGGPGQGASGYNAGYFANSMEEDYAMVYIDQRGNGASQGVNNQEDLTIAQNSEDIYLLTQLLKAKYGSDISMFLSGHSWGGLTSAHTLIYTEIQEELKGWIEMNGAHDFPKSDVETVKMFRSLGQQEIVNGNNLIYWEPLLEQVNAIDTLNISEDESLYLNVEGSNAEKKFDLADEESDEESSFGIDAPDRSYIGSIADGAVNVILNNDSEQYALTNELYQIEIPSLFLWGKYDFTVPPAIGESAYHNVGSTEKEVIIYQRSGHNPMSNQAIQFTDDVKAFIEKYK